MSEPKTVVVASNNAHKASEIENELSIDGWQFKTLRELGISSDPDENADSFLGNARIKAYAARKASGGRAVIADDSGLEVDALDGAPGVYSSRYAGQDATDDDNNEKLLAALAGVPDEKRTARFVCTLVFVDEDGTEFVARGTVEGRIGYAPRGTEGFGYDPLFYPSDFSGRKTFSEVTQDEKAEVSHRGRALRELARQLSARR